jgi:hypothetical protein
VTEIIITDTEAGTNPSATFTFGKDDGPTAEVTLTLTMEGALAEALGVDMDDHEALHELADQMFAALLSPLVR